MVGTRRRDTSAAATVVSSKFKELYEEGDWICSGGCAKGADRFAEQIAKQEGIPIITIYPNHKRYKQAAPIIRNGPVADTCDVIIACVIRPEDGIDSVLGRTKGGTEDTLRKFIKRTKRKDWVYLV